MDDGALLKPYGYSGVFRRSCTHENKQESSLYSVVGRKGEVVKVVSPLGREP